MQHICSLGMQQTCVAITSVQACVIVAASDDKGALPVITLLQCEIPLSLIALHESITFLHFRKGLQTASNTTYCAHCMTATHKVDGGQALMQSHYKSHGVKGVFYWPWQS